MALWVSAAARTEQTNLCALALFVKFYLYKYILKPKIPIRSLILCLKIDGIAYSDSLIDDVSCDLRRPLENIVHKAKQ
jgi:hypothetical protein